jgi:hypothetical protein
MRSAARQAGARRFGADDPMQSLQKTTRTAEDKPRICTSLRARGLTGNDRTSSLKWFCAASVLKPSTRAALAPPDNASRSS